ncbi:MAG TPA: gluconate 2-dehydrogenase subunit 3 family protein [Paraburkholderia sp.]|uniref:gluconate 2-dehydrogenase subunit 3 family protein n=1 Tax=Paraburkholderia sp. TaxID=1926495 RepID=UPI002ED3798E
MKTGRPTQRATRYPGYDVLNKRDTPSWDEPTRAVIDERLAVHREPRFFDAVEWRAVTSLAWRIVPQASMEPVVPVAALLDHRLHTNQGDGYRNAALPPMREAWRTGLAALAAESRERHELPFASLEKAAQIALLEQMQRGELVHAAWRGMSSKVFFAERVLHDLCGLYYSHPHAWSEIGFGGPANPRGYVRMYFNRRDPWEPVEAKPGDEDNAARENRRVR